MVLLTVPLRETEACHRMRLWGRYSLTACYRFDEDRQSIVAYRATHIDIPPHGRRSAAAATEHVTLAAKRNRPPKDSDGAAITPPAFVATKAFPIVSHPDDSRAETARKIAGQVTAPEANAWRVLRAGEANSGFGEMLDTAGSLEDLRRLAAQVNTGDMTRPEAMLINQAVALETLATRLIERGMAQTGLAQFETFMRLGLKAQAQSRLAIEALTNLKQGPTVIARQANLSGGGPMQVNNGPSREANSETKPNGLLNDEQGMDAGETRSAGTSDSHVAAVGTIDRTEKRRRQTALRR
jgi:hypothetical protein